ncbi:ATP-binding protein [Devosia aurantiaca]|nr:ATP-binding protein [Devosia aurantiaca]
MILDSTSSIATEILERDWSATALGHRETWPAALRTMVSFMLDADTPVWLAWGPDLTLLYNDAYRPLLGDKPPALGRPLREVWGEVWDTVGPLIDQTLSGKGVVVENAGLRVDRGHGLEDAWFSFSYTPLRDHEKVAGFICLVTETTEQALARRSEQFLSRLEEDLRTLADPAEIIQVSQRSLGQHLKANRVGYGSVDVTERFFTTENNWTDGLIESFNGTHDLAGFGPEIHGALKRGEPLVVDDVYNDPRIADDASKAAFAYLQTFSALTASLVKNGRMIAAFYIHCRDVRKWTPAETKLIQDVAERTWSALERAQAQNALERANRELEQRVETKTRDHDRLWKISQELMLVADHEGRITSINPSATRILGYDPEHLTGRLLTDFIHPDDLASTEREIRRLSEGYTTLAFENRYRHADGTYRVLDWTAVPFEDHIHAVGRDVTAEREAGRALRQTEEALRQAQKMEAVGQLTGGIAHDFNNIIAGITGSLELMSKRLAQGRVSEIERHIIGATGAANRAANLTQRLLAFSRRQTLEPKPTRLSALIAGMLELIQRSVGPEIEVKTVEENDLWTTFLDVGQLENALLNLCINARDAMPDGGTITIRSANTRLDASEARQHGLNAGDYVSLCVEDTGVGMPPEVVQRAFEPFYTTKPMGQGTGLGLSMVYGFAGQSGGAVNIRSKVGEGTVICLYLPRHQGQSLTNDADNAASEAILPEGKETVLVVDDEPLVRMVVVEALEDLGYSILEAGDGASALKVLESDAVIDLLVTDVGLPGGMNGRQVAAAAREVRPGLKVLFITGYAENAVLNHDHLEPGMQVLPKPFQMHALAQRVQELLALR